MNHWFNDLKKQSHCGAELCMPYLKLRQIVTNVMYIIRMLQKKMFKDKVKLKSLILKKMFISPLLFQGDDDGFEDIDNEDAELNETELNSSDKTEENLTEQSDTQV